MFKVNPDPHQAGYVYQPANTVTAFFPFGADPQCALRDLFDAGFAEEHVNVFTGDKGVSQLDLGGEKHGAWVQFRRGLEQVFADEADVYKRADQVLQSGGWIVTAFTEGDATKKEQAAMIFRAHHSQEVLYWGEWSLERL
jgi:hypothetical protein